MCEQVRQIIDEFVQRAQSLYGDRLKRIVVYGSCARNEATAESDIDLAVVLAGEVVPGKEIDRMIDIITDLNLEHSVLLSVYPVSEEDYLHRNSPLLINIRREGISCMNEARWRHAPIAFGEQFVKIGVFPRELRRGLMNRKNNPVEVLNSVVIG